MGWLFYRFITSIDLPYRALSAFFHPIFSITSPICFIATPSIGILIFALLPLFWQCYKLRKTYQHTKNHSNKKEIINNQWISLVHISCFVSAIILTLLWSLHLSHMLYLAMQLATVLLFSFNITIDLAQSEQIAPFQQFSHFCFLMLVWLIICIFFS